jgi:hypothetical protein
MRLEFFTAVHMKITVLWNAMTCNLVYVLKSSRGVSRIYVELKTDVSEMSSVPIISVDDRLGLCLLTINSFASSAKLQR